MRLRIFPTTQAPGEARRLMADTMAERLDEEALEALRTVISELVTISVEHGATEPIELRVEVVGDEVEGIVEDPGPGTRALLRAKRRHDNTYVMRIIDALVDEWHVTQDGVRFSLPARDGSRR